jgi:hypothetical protein
VPVSLGPSELVLDNMKRSGHEARSILALRAVFMTRFEATLLGEGLFLEKNWVGECTGLTFVLCMIAMN